MESSENKIIKDKIDSLHGLPAGYLPNLSSKWEIIEAGLPQQKKRLTPLLIRWAVAATIIACVAVGVKLKYNKTSEGMMAALEIPSLHVPIIYQKEKIIVATEPVTVKNNLQIVHKPAPVYRTDVIAKQNTQQQLKNDELKIDPLIEVIDSAVINTDELATIIPHQEVPKRSKRRAFQKDFNDGVLVMDTGYLKSANQQFGFKLQLHTSTGDDAQPSRRLQLKQVL